MGYCPSVSSQAHTHSFSGGRALHCQSQAKMAACPSESYGCPAGTSFQLDPLPSSNMARPLPSPLGNDSSSPVMEPVLCGTSCIPFALILGKTKARNINSLAQEHLHRKRSQSLKVGNLEIKTALGQSKSVLTRWGRGFPHQAEGSQESSCLKGQMITMKITRSLQRESLILQCV